jgi:DNA-directed RNA polymerase subunit RPC12/RpoP
MEENIAHWCERCGKKFFVSPENFQVYQQSKLMKKAPFLDHQKIYDKRTNLEMEQRKTKYKCMVCGTLLKEVENNVPGGDISS